MRKNKNKNILKVSVKKKYQSGGVRALSSYSSKSSGATPKVFIGLAKKYMRNQDLYSINTLNDVRRYLNSDDENRHAVFHKAKNYLKNRKAISKLKINKNTVYFSYWVKGPPMLVLTDNESDFKISEEETSIILKTVQLSLNKYGEFSIKEKETGIVVSIHAVARIIQRLGYNACHTQIKEELDHLIMWYSHIYYASIEGETPFMDGVSVVSENGVFSGTYVLLRNSASNLFQPIYFVRTFLSEGIMTEEQKYVFNYIKNSEIMKGQEKYIDNIQEGFDVDSETILRDLKTLFELKKYFYSKDKLIERFSDSEIKRVVDKTVKDDIISSIKTFF